MSDIAGLGGTWLRRLRRARLGSPDTLVGAQWISGELVLVRVLRDEARPEIEHGLIEAVPPERRADAIKRLAGTRVLRDAGIVLVLSPGQYDLHQAAAPAVPSEELRDALRWQLRGSLAYAPEEAALDFVRLPQGGAAHARETLLAVTAHQPVIRDAVAPFVDAGLDVVAVDIPEFAQRNLARGTLRTRGSHAWLGFERETCLLTAHLDDELAFARRMLLPGAGQNAVDADLPESIAHVTDRIVTQAQRTLDTYERQSGLPPVTEIVVGLHRHADAIGAALSERTGLATRLFGAAATFDFGADARDWSQALPASVLPALGAALRTEKAAAAGGLAAWAQRLRTRLERAA